MPDLRYASADARFGLAVPAIEVDRMLAFCRKAAESETGGILVGVYSDELDCALVRHVTGPGRNARAGRTWFERGTHGLQDVLHSRWSSGREYYLGEWHYHPAEHPTPSPQDRDQMEEIAGLASYHCPEPVLLIIGGEPDAEWSASAHVFPRGAHATHMQALGGEVPTRLLSIGQRTRMLGERLMGKPKANSSDGTFSAC